MGIVDGVSNQVLEAQTHALNFCLPTFGFGILILDLAFHSCEQSNLISFLSKII